MIDQEQFARIARALVEILDFESLETGAAV